MAWLPSRVVRARDCQDNWDALSSRLIVGKGDPEGNITAAAPCLFLRTDGGAGTTLYIKESGKGNTGWVAV